MMRPISTAAHWVGRHAFPALAATVIVVGAAGGGIGYALASQPTAAATSPTPAVPGTAKPAPLSGGGATRAPGSAQVARAVQQALRVIADQTGQSITTIRSELAAGKSVNDIAGAKAPAIESQILAGITKIADRAVKAGKITAAQETSDLALVKTKLAALIAEPGTQLLQDARNAIQFLQPHAPKRAAPAASATPAPTPTP